MGDKRYTAQEMRDEAKCFESRGGSIAIAAMLRQAADAMEREKKRKKKYEYAAMSNYDGYIFEDHCEEKKVKETFPCMKCYEYTVVRREVGEWEEVKE